MSTTTTPVKPTPKDRLLAANVLGVAHHAVSSGVQLDDEDVNDIATLIRLHVIAEMTEYAASDPLPPAPTKIGYQRGQQSGGFYLKPNTPPPVPVKIDPNQPHA